MTPWLSDLFLGSQSDERLVSLARAGHDRAFVAIAARYKRELVGFARRLGAESNAEDVVQQALMSALTALRGGTEVRHVRGWLHEIVRNAALKAAARAPIEQELSENLIAADDPAQEVERQLLVRSTLAAIAVLPDRQRDAFVKTAVQGRSRSEVALSMGLSEGAVRQLVHRARASLRTGVTAITPYPIAVWAASARPGTGSNRTAEIIFGAGSGSAGGLALKTGAAVVVSGVLATTVVVTHGRPAISHRTHRAVAGLKAPAPRVEPAGPSPGLSASALTPRQHVVHAVSYVATPSRHVTAARQIRVPVGAGAGAGATHRSDTGSGGGVGKTSPAANPVTQKGSGSGQDGGDSSNGAASIGDAGATGTMSTDGASSGDGGTSTSTDGGSSGDGGDCGSSGAGGDGGSSGAGGDGGNSGEGGTTTPTTTTSTPTPPAPNPSTVTTVAQNMSTPPTGD